MSYEEAFALGLAAVIARKYLLGALTIAFAIAVLAALSVFDALEAKQ